jgi:hypothetical protein
MTHGCMCPEPLSPDSQSRDSLVSLHVLFFPKSPLQLMASTLLKSVFVNNHHAEDIFVCFVRFS